MEVEMHLRRRLGATVLGALVFALLMSVGTARAITKTYVEDFEHPFVGLVVFYVADDGSETDDNTDPDFSHRCSGSLLSPTVFLTAGHCTDESEADLIYARVYFQQDAGANYDPETELDPVSGYPEYCATGTLGVTCATSDELYTYDVYDNFAGWPVERDTGDVGIVILDQPITVAEYGELAEPGTLDTLYSARGTQDAIFTVSGYGVTYESPVAFVSFRERLMATSTLINVKAGLGGGFNLQTNGNGGGRGGTCGGDSGGPVFLGDTPSNLIVGVTSYGLNEWCRGTDFAYRTDTADVYAWVTSFLD
jgi:secreted trypsin-like serine protease